MSGIIRIPKFHIVNATKQHTASLFFFHGSGGTGDDMKQWIDILNRRELNFPHIKIIYPTAPTQPYTPNNGMVSNVWFDRKRISIRVEEDRESINAMCHNVSELIDKEVSNGIPYERIAIGGFSMGGALALHVTYRFKPSLAGCVTMSSFLNNNSMVYEHLRSNPEASAAPLLGFHGMVDDLVPIKWGEDTHKNLKDLGVNATFVPLNNTSHELIRNEIEQFKEWILNVLPEK